MTTAPLRRGIEISTRTPLAGSDYSFSVDFGGYLFQPALPLRGVTRVHRFLNLAGKFQPALPLRGVTRSGRWWMKGWKDFNPHSPCGE